MVHPRGAGPHQWNGSCRRQGIEDPVILPAVPKESQPRAVLELSQEAVCPLYWGRLAFPPGRRGL